jgi:hypothetical protein
MLCPSCNGTGAGPTGPYSPRPPKCLDCDGTGKVDDPCLTCSDKDQDPDDPKSNCYHCGPPGWEGHDAVCDDVGPDFHKTAQRDEQTEDDDNGQHENLP